MSVSRRVGLAMLVAFLAATADGQEGRDNAPLRPVARWSALAKEIVPKIVERNLDLGSAVKYFRMVRCDIGITISTTVSARSSTGGISYYWEDRNDNGLLTEDEIDIEVDATRLSDRAVGVYLREIQRNLRRETASNTFNLFNLHHVDVRQTGNDYILEIRPVEGNPLTHNMAYDRLYLTVGPDMLVRRVQGRMQDGSNLAIDFRHGQVGTIPVVAGFRSQTTQSTGETTIIDRSHTYTLVGQDSSTHPFRLGGSAVAA